MRRSSYKHTNIDLELSYLHHEYDGVERDHCHDSILKWRRHHKLPHAVLEALLVLGHVSRQGPGVDGKVYTGSLRGEGERRGRVVYQVETREIWAII